MLAPVSMWLLAVTLSQVPQDPAWLKAIPADVDVVVRTRSIEETQADLVAFAQAVSPNLGAIAQPAIAGLVAQVQANHGDGAVKTPLVALIRAADAGDAGGMPFAGILMASDYKKALKLIAASKDDVKLNSQDGGYDSFSGPNGTGTWYAVKGAGFVAFGPGKALVADIAKRSGKSFGETLSPTLSASLLAGDVGLYVNIASLSTRYKAVIDQAREAMMAALDKAPGNAASTDVAKSMYGAFFDSIKYADALAFNLDLNAKGLHAAGTLAVKPDSGAAKAIATSHTGTAEDLGKFDTSAAYLVYFNLDPKWFEKLTNMSLRMLNADNSMSPEYQKASKELTAVGTVESAGAMTFSQGSMRAVNVVNVADPAKFIKVSKAMFMAMKSAKGDLNIYKDVVVENDVQTYQGFAFSRLVATLDEQKIANLSKDNPAVAASYKTMLGNGKFTQWYGTDGVRVITLMAPTWDDAKTQLDTYFSGKTNLSKSPGYTTVRKALPDKTNFLMLVNAQGFVRLLATQFAAAANKPGLKAADVFPDSPAFFGGSLTPRPPVGYEFHFVLPSEVGPVIEKSLLPLFLEMRAKGAQ